MLTDYFKIRPCIPLRYFCAMPAIKAFTLAFYLRLFFISKGFRRLIEAVGAYVFCWWVAVLSVTIFQCHPIGPIHSLSTMRQCIKVLVSDFWKRLNEWARRVGFEGLSRETDISYSPFCKQLQFSTSSATLL